MSDAAPDVLDAELARAMRSRRLPPVTAALLLIVLLALAFTAGVLVQKHHDKGLTASIASGNLGRLRAFGGFGGAGALPSAVPSGTPAVIGAVVRVQGSTVTVRNLGGRTVTVRTTPATTVTGAASVEQLRPGQGVAVSGSRAADGTVAATAIRVTS